LFIWPVKLPGPDGHKNEWHTSAHMIASQSVTRWVRMWSNRKLGAYEHQIAEANNPDPTFPDLSYSEIIKIAFKDNPLIKSHNHELMKRLRGE